MSAKDVGDDVVGAPVLRRCRTRQLHVLGSGADIRVYLLLRTLRR